MYSKSIQELIQERRSTRTYDSNRQVEKKKLAELEAFCNDLPPSPFGDKVKFIFTDTRGTSDSIFQIDTYRSIKNAPLYLLGTIPASERCYESCGFVFEQAILKATDLGLGTCWLFHFEMKSHLDGVVKDVFACASPIGYPSQFPLSRDFIIRSFLGEGKRRKFSELFYNHDFSHPLQRSEAGPYAVPLEMVRLAPSARNSQPWRVIIEDDLIHFFIDMPHVSEEHKKHSLNLINLGIALSHFELTCEELKIRGGYISVNQESRPKSKPSCRYAISWKST
jgi:nitroreductase